MPKVLNKRNVRDMTGKVYIGRPSKWGNPYMIGKDGTREEVIEKYESWLFAGKSDLRFLDLMELVGKDLVCWCAPLPCHGDVLLRLVKYVPPVPPEETQWDIRKDFYNVLTIRTTPTMKMTWNDSIHKASPHSNKNHLTVILLFVSWLFDTKKIESPLGHGGTDGT